MSECNICKNKINIFGEISSKICNEKGCYYELCKKCYNNLNYKHDTFYCPKHLKEDKDDDEANSDIILELAKGMTEKQLLKALLFFQIQECVGTSLSYDELIKKAKEDN